MGIESVLNDEITVNKVITLNAVVLTAETTLWTPAAGKRFRLLGGLVSIGVAAANVILRDGTAGATIYIIPKAPLDTPTWLPWMGNGLASAALNNLLTGQGIATTTISGILFGREE